MSSVKFSKVPQFDIDAPDVEILPAVPKEGDTQRRHSEDGAIPFDDALSLTKFGKLNYLLIIVSGLVFTNVLLETAAMGFILPIAQCDLQLSNQDKGILSAVGYIGIIISSHLWGFLADTKGRRRVIRPTLLAGFVVTVFSSFSHKFWLMVLLRLVNGFFVSGGSATIYAYLGEFHTDKLRSRAIMGSSFIFGLGGMVLPLIAFLVINQDWTLPIPFLGIVYKPWRLFMIVCGIPGFLCGLLMFFLPESPKFLLSVGREAEAIEVLQKVYSANGGKDELKIAHILPEDDDLLGSSRPLGKNAESKSNFVLVFLHTMWMQTMPLFQRRYLRSTLIVCTIQFWLHVTGIGMYMWFPHITNIMVEFKQNNPGEHMRMCDIISDREDSLNNEDGSVECITKLENTTYFYSMIMEILYATSFALLGLLIHRVGKIPLLFCSIIFFTSCGWATVFVRDPSIALYLYVMLFLVYVAVSVLGATTIDLYPTHLRAMAMCISLMVGRLGGVAGANITGALLDSHCELTFYISCGALILCGFLALLIPRNSPETERKKIDGES